MRILLMLVSTLFLMNPAWAEYPERPIRLIVSYPPGGGTDVTARQIVPMLSERLGKQVVIDNRSGAGSTLGTNLVAKAAPDGYTLLMSDTTFGIVPGLYPKLPYDAVRDFAPVAQITSVPVALVVHPSVAAKSVKDLVALAKAKPGALNFGSGGVGTPVHLAGELLMVQAQIKMLHIPYKGAGPAFADLLGGQFQLMFPTLQSVVPHVKSGRVRLLAMTTEKRSPAFPDVPTVIESGVPGVIAVAWFGIQAPAGTPKAVIARLHEEAVKVVREPSIRDRFVADGADPVGSTPDEFRKFIANEIGKWTKVVKAAGIKAEFCEGVAIGDAAWLQLTPETALEPALPICDPHHHIWAQRHEPPAYQSYLLPDLAADIRDSGHNIRSTVFIEVKAFYRDDGPQEMRPLGEVAHVNDVADEAATGKHGPTKIAAAIVGHADLKLGGRVAAVLEAMQAASPRFRGIRHSAGWDASPELTQRDIPGVMATEQYRAGARVLAKMGLTLDNSLYHTQLDELAALARAVPELTIVLNHIGGLVRVGPYADRDSEVLADWRRGMAAVAACPNVVLKLGGVGQKRFGFDWLRRARPIGSEELAAALRPLMHYCIEKFGPERCMFESNFPVDKVSYSYGVVWNAFKRLSESYSTSERAALFHDTAARVYRIGASTGV